MGEERGGVIIDTFVGPSFVVHLIVSFQSRKGKKRENSLSLTGTVPVNLLPSTYRLTNPFNSARATVVFCSFRVKKKRERARLDRNIYIR